MTLNSVLRRGDVNRERSTVSGTESELFKSPERLGGLLVRRERWGLSWQGRLIAGLIIVLASYSIVANVHSFLAITQRVNADVLVVEGWMNQNSLVAGADEFRKGSYQYLFTTGGPVPGSGGYINDYETMASVGADLLIKKGIPSECVQMVPSRIIGRDRTYNSALALREWCLEHGLLGNRINVLTEDAHARRTRLLYQKAFGPDVAVGIISVSNPDYDSKHWWSYSEGVREVFSESVAYVYAKFFFHPGNGQHNASGK